MKEHKYFVPFSIESFENARRFRDDVERGDTSHAHGVYMADLQDSIDWVVNRCLVLSTDADTCVRMRMPGLVLLQYWSQAFCLVQDPSNKDIWYCCFVDEEYGFSSEEAV